MDALTSRIRLHVPAGAHGVVALPMLSGTSRYSARTHRLLRRLHGLGLATAVMDLLTFEEEQLDHITAHMRHDQALITSRVASALKWLAGRPEARPLPLLVLARGHAAAPALVAASYRPGAVQALAGLGGGDDLASAAKRFKAPLLCLDDCDEAALDAADWLSSQTLGGDDDKAVAGVWK